LFNAHAGSHHQDFPAAFQDSSRCFYAGVAEVSLYVAARARRMGIGRALLIPRYDEKNLDCVELSLA
jgi:L-amino acid N-acyltransferase YncA